MLSKMEERIAKIIHSNETAEDAACQILADSSVNAHFEQRIANENVRELRKRGVCPVCGADEE